MHSIRSKLAKELHRTKSLILKPRRRHSNSALDAGAPSTHDAKGPCSARRPMAPALEIEALDRRQGHD
jgi:hypothetical protein